MADDEGRKDGENAIVLEPVGVVRSSIQDPLLLADFQDIELRGDLEAARGQAKEASDAQSEIVVYEDCEELVDGIEGFSHLLVLYWAHRVPPEGRSLLKVHPIGRKEFPLKGIFATCSPARPNPILVNDVRLIERKGNVLRVEGLEAVEGSPLVDIKPYVPAYYRVEDVR